MKKHSRPATIAAHAAGALDPQTGGVVPAWQPSTTYYRDASNALVRGDNLYARDQSDTLRQAEEVLRQLEGAAETLLFPSGMAATAALFRTLPRGARVVLQKGIYWGTTAWVREFCAAAEIALTEVPAAEMVQAVGQLEPELTFAEMPSNPWLEVVDITALAEAGTGLLCVDATAATPVLMKPLGLGADVVMHSATKAINGHSDVLAGVLSIRDAGLPVWTRIKADRKGAGAILGSFEAWLLIRGMRTLPLRVERMSANAQALAEHLAAHSEVEGVLYPGLSTHPGHDKAARQMQGGFGSLMSVLVKGDRTRALQVLGRLDLFLRATSLGGVESLVEHRASIEPLSGIPENLIRVSVGIEAAEDLIADWDNALSLP